MKNEIKKNYQVLSEIYDVLNKKKVINFARKFITHIEKLYQKKISTIIDFGCGTGILLDFLYSKNISKNVVGIDISKEMIDIARLKNEKITWVVNDLSIFKNDLCADLAICINESLNYVDKEKMDLTFKNFNENIKMNGILYLDFDTDNDLINHWEGQYNKIIGKNWSVDISYKFDKLNLIGTEIHKIKLNNKNKIFTELHSIFPISYDEIIQMAKKNGFEIIYFVEPEKLKVINNNFNNYLRIGCFLRKITSIIKT